MKKKIAILLALITVFSITGCNVNLKKADAKQETEDPVFTEEAEPIEEIEAVETVSDPDITDDSNTIINEVVPEDYYESILNNLVAPLNPKLENLCSSEVYANNFYYTYRIDDGIRALTQVKDFTGNIRYQIFTKFRLWMDDDESVVLTGKDSVYGCENELIYEGNLVSFYEGMYTNVDPDDPLYMFYDGLDYHMDEYENSYYSYDIEDHVFSCQICFSVCDTLTGKTYESPYSEIFKYSKEAIDREFAPMNEFKETPFVTDYAKKYQMAFDSDFVYPVFYIRFMEDDEVRRNAIYNEVGNPYISIDAKDVNGEWQHLMLLDYDYFVESTWIPLYLPCEFVKSYELYNENDLPIRARYEFRLNGDFGNEDPYSCSEYMYMSLNFM